MGASETTDSLGAWILTNLHKGGYRGTIFAVNPSHQSVSGLRCYNSLADLPEVPDLVAFAVGDQHLEAALDEAILLGVPAAVIQSALVVDGEKHPPLRARVQEKLQRAGMLVCGANGMGYYNVRDRVWTCGFDSADHAPSGNVALISHSGSGMSGIVDCDERVRINVAVSAGNELTVTMDQYLDFVLDLPETRVVGLFIETARNPDGFRAALDKARRKRVPVVALKVGRTQKSAELAVSHSGALAGDDATYDALFDYYGVQRVNDQDELATALILFSELHPVGAGGLVTLHDSGGERQLMIDLAEEIGVPMTALSASTVDALAAVIDPELPAVNPLDAWSRGGPDSAEQMTRALTLMMQDEGAAVGAVIHDRAPYGRIYPGYLAYMQRARAESGKPVALVAARQGTGHDPAVVTSTHAGYPILDGIAPFLRGVLALFAYRDYLLREDNSLKNIEEKKVPDTFYPSGKRVSGKKVSGTLIRGAVGSWLERLRGGESLSELESLALLRDFGLPTSEPVYITDEDQLSAAAKSVGFPLVLKSAKPGLVHKSDVGGVMLGIETDEQLLSMYRLMRNRLGDAALIASAVDPGQELFLGIRRDPQFGPVVILGIGGVLAETVHDVQFALPPFDTAHARRLLDRLQFRPLLDGVRGAPPADVMAFCEFAARFSTMVHALTDVLAEIDVNPVIVNSEGAIAVDALVIGRDRRKDANKDN